MGKNLEASTLAGEGITKNNIVFRPTEAETQSATFKAIVGDAKYTKGNQLRGTIFDDTEGGGTQELKLGATELGSRYQTRLQIYYSVTRDAPMTLYTTRPVSPSFQGTLDFWGVSVKKPGGL